MNIGDIDVTVESSELRTMISGLVTGLPEHIEAASLAASNAHMTLCDLARLRDYDLFDGGEPGQDALTELSEAMRHLRNARRIAERRLELLSEEDTDAQLAVLTRQREAALALASEAFIDYGADIQAGGQPGEPPTVDAHDLVNALGADGEERARHAIAEQAWTDQLLKDRAGLLSVLKVMVAHADMSPEARHEIRDMVNASTQLDTTLAEGRPNRG